MRIWLREGGTCYLCGYPVAWGTDLEIEHPIALAHGGSDDDAALRCVHGHCHKAKTSAGAKTTAKIKRILARREGTRRERKKIPSRPFPKKKMSWYKAGPRRARNADEAPNPSE